ncbi:DUF7168 domain-containing protein [Paenirhodobacter populi]|nr:DUF2786 domain-containing protein [Sinirhodobacter populi]
MSPDSEKARILAKLAALHAKVNTTSGTSEAEAMAAAAMIAKLMERHDIEEAELISRGDIDIGKTEIVFEGAKLDDVVAFSIIPIREVSETQIVRMRSFIGKRTTKTTLIIYGTEADRAFAAFLFDVILMASRRGWKKFMAVTGTSSKNSIARRSYKIGFSAKIGERLMEIAKDRADRRAEALALTHQCGSNNVLVPVSKAVRIIERMGDHAKLKPRQARAPKTTGLNPDALWRGLGDGDKVTLNRPLN